MPVRRRGRLCRDPRAEYDWFYLLDAGLQGWIRRNVFADVGAGLPPDELAELAGFDYVDEWGDALVTACKVARDRDVAASWEDTYAADDDAELMGPDELAELLDVSRSAIRQWRHRGLLPTPDLCPACPYGHFAPYATGPR
ncbi:MAG TPA: helix-turn-helix domain-containing protein [Acidimicrobiales bacterium]|nr:helix-turn-helix domain-containing protein [Acidimicrobiales bacterium]